MEMRQEPDSPQLPVSEAVRAIFLDKRSGLIEVPGGGEGEKKRLFFADGELHLPEANPIAQRLAPLLPGAGGSTPPGWMSGSGGEVKALMARIARIVQSWHGLAYTVHDGRQVLPPNLVGPLPTAFLIMEWAAMDLSEAELLEQLGGSAARWVVQGGGPAASVSSLLDPQEMVLLSRLSGAQELSDLVQQAGDDGAATLRRLARLAAVGVIQRERSSVAHKVAVPSEVLRRLAYRVETGLAENPLDLGPETHRELLHELLASSGAQTHYELLGLDDNATVEEVHEAYDSLARRVHPSHSSQLGLEGREPALWLLFERATAAYLTLSDPAQRRSYDVKVGMRDPGPSPDVRRREAERLAESYHRRALLLLDEEDYHFAVELLKQAVMADPRPEYYVRLGEAQAKNPNWLRHALQSLEKAIDLGYPEPGIWSSMGRIFEELGDHGEARRHFRIALDRRPEDPEALAGLARLEALAIPEPRRRGLFGLFRRR